MKEELENNILYRPHLSPEKSYKSDGSFFHEKEPSPDLLIPSMDEDDPYRPLRVKTDLEELRDVIDASPEEVRFIADTVVNKLVQRIDVAFPKGLMPPKRILEHYVEPPTPMDEIDDGIMLSDDLPDLFPPAPNIEIVMQQPISMIEAIESDYRYDQLNLAEYYASKMQYVFQQFYQHIFTMMAELGIDSVQALLKDFEGEAVQIPPGRSLEHCRDSIVRNQNDKKQKNMLFKKTHSTDETLQHLRSMHAAHHQRRRYYYEAYKDNDDYTLTHSNMLLKKSRFEYDEKYKKSVDSMFKYLDSSVQTTKEILSNTLEEVQAKGMLLKNGVDIYETSYQPALKVVIKKEDGTISSATNYVVKKSTLDRDSSKDNVVGGEADALASHFVKPTGKKAKYGVKQNKSKTSKKSPPKKKSKSKEFLKKAEKILLESTRMPTEETYENEAAMQQRHLLNQVIDIVFNREKGSQVDTIKKSWNTLSNPSIMLDYGGISGVIKEEEKQKYHDISTEKKS